ncbi:OLC1v1035979C1 [Oldenlandia corymbosa var. corymbosa]|uniref:OLC1v1035979C1 n=1 Tax=Oldenlandia corymbosa var. corymbosa TaxID=529605 RepID=A0AAV1CU99_OLDCO|nr:OLC1v1035979C1 [Oldenlandia corymbosa var. corymbosa]
MGLTIHAMSGNKNVFKALIAAEYSDVKVELTKDFQMRVTNKTPKFLKMNPLWKRGLCSRVILLVMGQIKQWIDFTTTEIDANIGRWLYPRLGYQVYLPPAEEAAIFALKRALGALNTHLALSWLETLSHWLMLS